MRRIPTPALLATAGAALLGSAAALAQAGITVIGQKDRSFSESELSLRRGAQVRFANDDSVAHNVIVRDPAGETFTSPLQRPGDFTDVIFATLGAYEVRCALHPRMRMSIVAQ